MTVTWTGNEIVPDRRERDVPRGAGFDNVPESPSGTATRRAHCHTGLPREARCGLVSRRRRRPPACHRRGRRPSNPPPERLRRWDDAGSPRRTRRPEMRDSATATAAGTASGTAAIGNGHGHGYCHGFSHHRPSGTLGRPGVPASQRRTSSVVARVGIGRAATTLLARRRPAS